MPGLLFWRKNLCERRHKRGHASFYGPGGERTPRSAFESKHGAYKTSIDAGPRTPPFMTSKKMHRDCLQVCEEIFSKNTGRIGRIGLTQLDSRAPQFSYSDTTELKLARQRQEEKRRTRDMMKSEQHKRRRTGRMARR